MRISDWSSDVCSSDLGEGLMLRWPNRSVFRVLRPLVAAPDTSGATRGRDGLATEPEGGAAMTKYAGLDVSMEEKAIWVVDGRTEERRGGKECGSAWKFRWSRSHEIKTKIE